MKVTKTMMTLMLMTILLFSNMYDISAQEPNTTPWRITIHAAHGSDTPKERTFGVEQGGTDGYDNNLDVVSPPAPQSWYTYLYMESFPNSLQTDIRDNTVEERNYGLGNTWCYVIINAGLEATVLTWDVSSFPQGSHSPGVLELRTGADVLIADMLASTTVSVSGDQDLYIRYQVPKNSSSSIDGELLPNHNGDFYLCQNYPNPFNNDTAIRYYVVKPSNIRLSIFNLLGQKVRILVDEALSPGWYSVKWDGYNDSGTKLISGMYLVRMKANTQVYTKTIHLIQ